ncbi:MAG: branched-chain amino acid aminotransferase [Chitinivibrionales bacterium]|nr:branched-chain amino acid aminotransferase [Chitinivibrionales bacterium]
MSQESIVFYNGSFIREGDFTLSPFSRALHYGDGVFETMRAYGGAVFRFDLHLERFFSGLQTLSITNRWARRDIYTAVSELLMKNGLGDASVKILGFRSGPDGPNPVPGSGADIMIAARPFDAAKKALYEKGITACVASNRRNKDSIIAAIKSLNYLENIIGRIEAAKKGCDEVLFLNTCGNVAEGATSNIFIVKKGSIAAPPLHAGILNGITRGAVIQIAREKGIACNDKDILLDDVLSADEVFLTNSLMEIMPLVRVDDTAIGGGSPGMVTMKLMSDYRALVEKELAGG